MTSTPATSEAPTATATAPQSPAQFNETPAFTSEQLRIIAADAVSSGRMTRAEADDALHTEHSIVPEKPDVTFAPEAAEIDAMWPAAKEHEYSIPIGTPGQELNAEQTAGDRQARGWLAAARFPREIGSSLAAEIARVGSAWERMGDADRQLYSIKEQQRLDALWGTKKAENLDLARQLVRELDAKHPGVAAMLDRSGAGHSANVIAQVHAQARRLAMRKR